MKFVIKKNADGAYFWFVLIARNGQIVATSEIYTRKQAAEDTIEAIIKGIGEGASIEDST
jgi:uncharacterized protein YegP (UPF0339 family)